VFHLAQVLDGELVVVPQPAYPVYERGAVFAGKQVFELPLRGSDGFLPDLESVGADVWRRTAILWLNYPNNPTAATAPLELYERAAELARSHDFVVASDEAYSELYFGAEAPASALQVADRTNVAVFNTLSKRSSMPGYRSGFAAGDAQLVAALKRYRPNVGTAPPTFLQRASVVAWSDEEHVVETRERYGRKRDIVLPALQRIGLEPAGGDASFFLWLRVPDDGDAEAFALRLLDELGIVVAPGPFFGPGGEGHVRAALVPTLDECRRAAELLTSIA
jgi:aspartate/methionine/tyrosine aminotransferase